MDLWGGSDLYFSGSFLSDGSLRIRQGASVAGVSQSSRFQSSGAVVVDGALTNLGRTTQFDGPISGSGVIEGNVFLGGVMSPGDPVGALTIRGNYTQLPGGAFRAEIGGTAPGIEYDQLLVSGHAVLGGTLDVLLLNGFQVNVGDHFVLMTFDSEGGRHFSKLDLPNLPEGDRWILSYESTDILLAVEPSPEPGTLFLLGTGMFAIGEAARRKLGV